MWCAWILAAIQLTGVTGHQLRARAFFDANNVKVGDPLNLTIDFLGSAEFKDLHPPTLSRVVSKKDWKIDDVSAKTDTYRDARRLTYRVRPVREGVIWFPALEFAYRGEDGSERIVRANEIPVHARAGEQVVVQEMDAYETGVKMPELIAEPGVELSDDRLFAWKRALARPSIEAFKDFDFPVARLNEAAMALKEGNWTRALSIYERLEWSIGQTQAIEDGLRAVYALKYDNPQVELPMWRQVLRPLLRFPLWPRIGIVLGGGILIALVFWLIGRSIRALASVAIILLALPLAAETIETVTTNADGSVEHRKIVRGGSGGVSFSFSSSSTTGGKGGMGIEPSSLFDRFDAFDPFFGRSSRKAQLPQVEIKTELKADKRSVVVGEDFNLVLTVETPKTVSIADGISLSLGEQNKLVQLRAAETLRPEIGVSNIIQTLVFPMRATSPFTNVTYVVSGEYCAANDRSFFRATAPFRAGIRAVSFAAEELPRADRPQDFSGIVANGLRVHEYCDLIKVGTNDIVTITYKMYAKGFVPRDYLPKDVAFEWERIREGTAASEGHIEYRRFFVADGSPTTPVLTIPYYDPRTKSYKTARAGGTTLLYQP